MSFAAARTPPCEIGRLNEAALAAYAKVKEPEANESRDHVRIVQARRAKVSKS